MKEVIVQIGSVPHQWRVPDDKAQEVFDYAKQFMEGEPALITWKMFDVVFHSRAVQAVYIRDVQDNPVYVAEQRQAALAKEHTKLLNRVVEVMDDGDTWKRDADET